MQLFRSLEGIRQVTLTSADPAGAIRALQDAGIVLLEPEMIDALTWQFRVNRLDGKLVAKIAEKRGDICRFSGKSGLYWVLHGLKKRPVLVIGMLMLFALSLWVPSRVFFIRVEGNGVIPEREIIEKAREIGIDFGANRRYVRSERVKNQLLASLPDLQWAGVNTSGCVAVITVRERVEQEILESVDGVCSIIAARDGIVSSATVLQGNSLCSPGQAVKAGQVLISGYMDCGICIRAVRADGEILGLTKHTLSVISPLERSERGQIHTVEKKYTLIIGKKQINFYKDSGILGMSCAKIYEQKYLTLSGGFRLPISVVCEQRIYYEATAAMETESEEQLRAFARQYVLAQTTAGKIEYSQELFTDTNGCAKLDGIYGCLENIGVVRMEESIPDYGKSD